MCDAVGAHHPTASPPTSSAAADLAVFVARTTEAIVVVTAGAAGWKRSSSRGYRAGALPGSTAGDAPETDVIAVDAAPLRDGEAIVDTVGAGDAFVGAFGPRAWLEGRGGLLRRHRRRGGDDGGTREGAQGGTHGAVDVEERSRSVGMSADWGRGSEPAASTCRRRRWTGSDESRGGPG